MESSEIEDLIFNGVPWGFGAISHDCIFLVDAINII